MPRLFRARLAGLTWERPPHRHLGRAISMSVDPPPSGGHAADLCGEYLLLDGEIASLVHRWQATERQAIERHQWFDLSEAQRQVLPEAEEMDALDARLDGLFARRRVLLEAILAAEAGDVRSIAAKLAVALRTIQPEDGLQTHALLASVLSDLSVSRCPCCSTPLTAPAPDG